MKKNVCIFIGYTSMIREEIYGTEICIMKLSSYLSKFYNVFVVTLADDDTIRTDNFIYINYNNLYTDIDILIISRYINYFIYCSFKPCKKVYLWVHDVMLLSHYNGFQLENGGKMLLEHCIDKVDKIIVLSEWHKSFFESCYDFIPKNKIMIIGNGISINDFLPINISRKQKNRFIWTSCLNRGIERCVEIIQKIHSVFPDTELYVFRDFGKHHDFIESISHLSYIHFRGKVSNIQIIEEFKQSDFWFYPTTFKETYCISALEAQISGCIAISTDVASLNTTVGEHGILLNDKLSNDEIAEEVIKIMNDEKLKNKIRERGQKWAKQQDWSIISKKWINLFNDKKFWIF